MASGRITIPVGLDKMEDELKDVQKQSDKTAKAVNKVGDDGFSKAGHASGEFKQEALANFSEVTSSFDGSMSSIQDLAQGTLGGLAASGLPGVGLAAGLAATAVGLIGAAITANDEDAKLSEENIANWADAWIEAGGRVMTQAQIVGKFTSIATDPEQYKVAAQNAKDWGVDEQTALRAMAGDTDALAVTRDTLNGRQEEATRLLAEQETQTDKNAGKAYDLADAVDRGTKSFETLTGEMEAGKAIADTVAKATETMEKTALEKTRTTRQSLEGMLRNIPANVVMNVDRSAVDKFIRYPPTITIPARIALDNTRQKI
jgi:hypothetical protein